jgi:hypothetical protein
MDLGFGVRQTWALIPELPVANCEDQEQFSNSQVVASSKQQ